ncbi:MAG: TRAP transporter large permease [Paracoccaceae bacterium]|nr:TRAP transporter large permease [Paracoccaceae bacterium]
MIQWLLGPEADVPGALFGIGYNFDYCLFAATETEPGAACGPLLVGVICIVLLFGLALLGVRIAFAAAIAGFVGLVEMIGFTPGAAQAGTVPYAKTSLYALSVLPPFILIGFLAFHAGMTSKLFDAARKWIGWLPGGLAVATVMAQAGFAAVSGASTATAAVFSRVAIPEMLRFNYDTKLAAGVVAAGGTLATLIPPSAILVIYALIVEESVGALLLAGFLPGIFSALVYAGIIVLWAKFKPDAGPPVTGFSWSERFRSLPGVIPIVIVAMIIITAIYDGWATVTEAGALGAFVVLVIAVTQGMRFGGLKEALMDTARLTVMIFTLIWGIFIFVTFLNYSTVPQAFSQWIVDLPYNPYVILFAILIGYAVLGMFMDAIGMLLVTLPIFYPAVMALNGGDYVTREDSAFGLDATEASIWFGIIVVKMAEVCLITPPIGLNCFVVNGVQPQIPLAHVFRGILLFFIADLLTIAGLVMFPEIVTWLPALLRG